MSYPGIPFAPYEIRVDQGPQGLRTELRLDDVNALPAVVKQLAEMGYDLSDTAKALREAEEEQRKRKRDELEENRRHALAGLEATSKRFVIAYNKIGQTNVGTVEGVIYGDGRIALASLASLPFVGQYLDEEQLRQRAATLGYELFVKRFD